MNGFQTGQRPLLRSLLRLAKPTTRRRQAAGLLLVGTAITAALAGVASAQVEFLPRERIAPVPPAGRDVPLTESPSARPFGATENPFTPSGSPSVPPTANPFGPVAGPPDFRGGEPPRFDPRTNAPQPAPLPAGNSPLAADSILPQPDEPLADIRVEGNVTIPPQAIAKHIKTRSGRPVSQAAIREDVRSLYRTRWFLSIEPNLRRTQQGLVLVFRVVERPIVRNVQYVGCKNVKEKELAARTGIRVGSPFDVGANRQAAKLLEEYYQKERGHAFATVELARGGDRADREVIFQIQEGPKVAVTKVSFVGNENFSGTLLKTKLRTKTAVLWVIGGKYDDATIPDDIAALKQYYYNLGYFDVDIKENVMFSEANWVPLPGERAHAEVQYIINEGPRYRVRRVDMYGLNSISESEFRPNMELTEGEYYNARFLAKDVEALREQYGEQGRLFAKIDAVPRFLEEQGWVDVVFQVDEDEVYRIRRVDVVFRGENPHTKRSVVLNRVLTRPGELASAREIDLSRSRLRGTQYFETSPGQAPSVRIERVNYEEESLNPRGQNAPATRPQFPPATRPQAGRTNIRGQNAGSSQQKGNGPPRAAQPAARPVSQPAAGRVSRPMSYATPNANQYPDVHAALKQETGSAGGTPSTLFRGQSFDPFQTSQNFLSPQGDPLDPTLNGRAPREVDVIYELTEARTGRLMFGVGVNSDSGVVGSIVLSEQNFDLFNLPTSVGDIIDGNAFRGGGQRFRAEAIPGSEVSRYLVSWTDPFFLDTDFSLNVSGFYYQRFFPDWDERRGGGRVGVGYQFDENWSVNSAIRLEEVQIANPDLVLDQNGVVQPRELARAEGSSFLSTARGSIVHDTRDSAFMPGAGHRLELSYEQAFGDFSFPKLEIDAKQYYTLFERADGGGRHILTLSGQGGWTGSDTPVFERFFAGGFQTFRGYDFRGVGPEKFGVRVGGEFMALGSVEYMFPLLANDMLQGVVFTDFGTVDEDVNLDKFRLSVGAGLRVTVPALGPVPLAFDWAYSAIDEDTDDTRIFTFTMGFNR